MLTFSIGRLYLNISNSSFKIQALTSIRVIRGNSLALNYYVLELALNVLFGNLHEDLEDGIRSWAQIIFTMYTISTTHIPHEFSTCTNMNIWCKYTKCSYNQGHNNFQNPHKFAK